jgi:hypothetical protein
MDAPDPVVRPLQPVRQGDCSIQFEHEIYLLPGTSQQEQYWGKSAPAQNGQRKGEAFMDDVIVGAGLSGLAAARALAGQKNNCARGSPGGFTDGAYNAYPPPGG